MAGILIRPVLPQINGRKQSNIKPTSENCASAGIAVGRDSADVRYPKIFFRAWHVATTCLLHLHIGSFCVQNRANWSLAFFCSTPTFLHTDTVRRSCWWAKHDSDDRIALAHSRNVKTGRLPKKAVCLAPENNFSQLSHLYHPNSDIQNLKKHWFIKL